MSPGETYPVARAVAPRLHAHFAKHVSEASARGQQHVAAVPDVGAIEAMIEAAFWSSLRREEGFVPRISLAFVSPSEATSPLNFANPLPLDATALSRVAPAVERPGIHLGVSRVDGNGEPLVWGTVRSLPVLCFVLEVAAPGLLVIKHQRGAEASKFVNVAVLEGDQIKVIDERASSLPDCPPLLSSLLGFDSPSSWVDSTNILVQLAVSMRAHRRGGSLLLVPSGNDTWLESIVQPIIYPVQPPFTELALLVRDTPETRSGRFWQDAVARSIDAVAGLTAVDGATILTADYHLLAFGAKIARRKGSPQVEQITLTEPIQGGLATVAHPSQMGGTRHLSAAQFTHDQRDTLALVASQDGRFTVFTWSSCEEMVHAHRVETLLL
jgi:hypothetical protein